MELTPYTRFRFKSRGVFVMAPTGFTYDPVDGILFSLESEIGTKFERESVQNLDSFELPQLKPGDKVTHPDCAHMLTVIEDIDYGTVRPKVLVQYTYKQSDKTFTKELDLYVDVLTPEPVEESKPFVEGDVVGLKSGGPWMTIQFFNTDGLTYCAWFVGDSLQRGAFVQASLVRREDV